MKLKEAIEIVSNDNFGCTWPTPAREKEALKLLIEAGTLIRDNRQTANYRYYVQLPGETEE